MNAQNVVLVTGVTSGIGEAIAKLLSELGFRVFRNHEETRREQ